jgi:hypothetical protein
MEIRTGSKGKQQQRGVHSEEPASGGSTFHTRTRSGRQMKNSKITGLAIEQRESNPGSLSTLYFKGKLIYMDLLFNCGVHRRKVSQIRDILVQIGMQIRNSRICTFDLRIRILSSSTVSLRRRSGSGSCSFR